MHISRLSFSPAICIALLLAVAIAQDSKSAASKPRLDSPGTFEVVNGRTEMVTYRGQRALHLQPRAGDETGDDSMMAILTGSNFKDGTIEADVAGAPRAGAAANMKGFIGIAFRVQPHGSASELIYLRPSNGRSDDQLTRNHSVQYISDPDYGWQRLRQETPGLYESYADLEPGAWTKIKIVVSGTKASLYVNSATQPCLVVNDLKRGESHGQVALWAHATTEAYFANVTIH